VAGNTSAQCEVTRLRILSFEGKCINAERVILEWKIVEMVENQSVNLSPTLNRNDKVDYLISKRPINSFF